MKRTHLSLLPLALAVALFGSGCGSKEDAVETYPASSEKTTTVAPTNQAPNNMQDAISNNPNIPAEAKQKLLQSK